MYEVIFLFALALIWLVFASIQDLRKREVSNWISFSLIIFALGFRFFYCLFSSGNFRFFYFGLMGLGIFFIIGNLLYYGRTFAGGDAKLMIALGTILPFSNSFLINIKIFIWFFLIFLFFGGLYGFVWSIVLSIKNFKNFKKEFFKQLNENKKLIYLVMLLGLVFMAFGLKDDIFLILGVLIFISSYFYIFAKAVDESCMIKKIKSSQLTEGDWLYKNVRIDRKYIKASWEGLNKKEIKSIQKNYKSILIRQGIPFVPVFLISFLILFYLLNTGFLDLWWLF